ARVIPLYITDLAILLQNMFMPKLTIFFAKNDDEGLKRELKTGMNLLSVIVSLPLAVMTVFGKEFYTLWQPTIDAELLYILSILASVNMYFTCGVMCVFNLFTVKNRLRPYAVIQLVTGAVSTVAVLILVKFTSLGIYAIAGTSSVCLLLGGIFGSIPYASKLAGEKGSRYYPQMLKSFFNTALICAIGFGVKFIIKSGSWFGLAAGAAVTCAAGFALSFFVLLGKSERREFKTLLGHKFLH
ncbi:MAG: hypothetical protein IJL87_02190, partial [Clostridia bacterium]|nr:hypothetical protein [Clostridia bacterium]